MNRSRRRLVALLALLGLGAAGQLASWRYRAGAKRPLAGDAEVIELGTGQLSLVRAGSDDAAIAVVFVHGLAMTSRAWRAQWDAIGDDAPGQILRVAIDLPGHGRSSRSESGVESLADAIAAAIASLPQTVPVVLVGHSLGAIGIAALAATRPELFGPRIEAAVLLSGAAKTYDQMNLGALRSHPRLARPLISLTRHRPLARAGHGLIVAAGPLTDALVAARAFGRRRTEPGIAAITAQMFRETPLTTFATCSDTLADFDVSGRLGALAGIDTVLIDADDDQVIPPAATRHLHAELPGATRILLHGGHNTLLEHSDLVSREIRRVVNRHLRQSTA